MSIKHRIPPRLRQHWKVAATACVGVAATVALIGDDIVHPYVSSQALTVSTAADTIQGTRTLFDESSVHDIDVSFDETEYQDMLAEFEKDGTKNYIHATVIIDGTTLQDVGLRLKGNSTLQSLRGGDQAPAMGGGGPSAGNADAAQDGNGARAPMGGGGPSGVQLDSDKPEELPWLIKFDEFVEDQNYQGHYELSLRPQLATSAVALNEAVSLALSKESGQVTQDFAFTTVSVNGSEKAARIVVDHPDELWADSLGSGVLYKAKASGSFDYLGDDLTEYEESFKQINRRGEQDLTPVLKLLDFVNNSSDEEFAANLADYLDVDSFATYLATMEIVGNQDAMDGPGNNYYLYFDEETQKISVLSWDLNLSLGTSMGGGPGGGPSSGGLGMPQQDADQSEDATGGQDSQMQPPGFGQMPSQGGFPGGDAGAAPQGMPAMPPMRNNNAEDSSSEQDATTAENQGFPTPPEGMPDGFTPPEGMPEGFTPPEGNGDGRGFPGGQGSGLLKQRFLANEDFAALYEQAYADLYQSLIASGSATSILDTVAELAKQTGDTSVDTARETIANYFDTLSETAPNPQATSRGRGMPNQQPEPQAEEAATATTNMA